MPYSLRSRTPSQSPKVNLPLSNQKQEIIVNVPDISQTLSEYSGDEAPESLSTATSKQKVLQTQKNRNISFSLLNAEKNKKKRKVDETLKEQKQAKLQRLAEWNDLPDHVLEEALLHSKSTSKPTIKEAKKMKQKKPAIKTQFG
jgi:hypothetical protein